MTRSLLVASGYSSRVIVAGLTFGEDLLPSGAEPWRRSMVVRIEPQWTADEVGASVAVVRAGAAERP